MTVTQLRCGRPAVYRSRAVCTVVFHRFYRAMHFSAKRGIGIACRPSVCRSVTLVDQLIARTVSPVPSLFVTVRSSTYSQAGEPGEILGRLEVGWEKWRTKATISLKRVKIEEQLLLAAYRNSPTLCRNIPFPSL